MDWTPYLPPDKDVQVSRSQDFEACAAYSFIHIVEMLLKKQTGLFFEFSERYTAKVTDTQPWGNSLDNVRNSSNTNGIALVQDWPELAYSTNYQNIDWATYYATIPKNILNRAYRIQASYYKIVDPSHVAAALENAPLWTIVQAGSHQHCVAQINKTQFFDSYEIKIKNFSDGYPIISQHVLTIKFINMPNAEFVQKQGSGEYGFYLPALSSDALKDKAMNFGINILDGNGNVDFTLAKPISGL